MAVYNVLLNITEVTILTFFVRLYYDLCDKKSKYLLFSWLFIVCEACDIYKQNGMILMSLYFVVSYCFVVFEKKKILFGDIFVLIVYLFLLTACVIGSLYFYRFFFSYINSTVLTILIGVTSKVLLLGVTYIIVHYFKYQIYVPNKQYIFVILIEILIAVMFIMVAYSITNIDKFFNPFIVCDLLIVSFIIVIMNGIYFNKVYTEKLKLEKQIQKEKYIQQSLYLIENMNYDMNKKEHRMYWILEKIKQLNNNENKDITFQIEQFQIHNKKKNIYSKNLLFDTVLTLKINKLLDKNINIKPLLEIESHEKYDDLDFINTVTSILDGIQDNKDITLHIKNQGIYIFIELYSLQDFYCFHELTCQSDLVIKKSQFTKNDMYYVRFLLRSQDESIREEL